MKSFSNMTGLYVVNCWTTVDASLLGSSSAGDCIELAGMGGGQFGTDEFLWLRVFKLICYGFVFLFGVTGNTAVIWLVFCNASRLTHKGDYNYCLAYLAISDLAVLTINLPFRLAYQENGYDWPFGFAMYKIVPPLTFVFVTTSSLFLMAVSLDRYRAIVTFFKPHFHSKQFKIVVPVCTWLLSFVVVTPLYVFMTILTRGGRTVCTDAWPSVQHEQVYFVSIFFLQFAFPMGFMAVLYAQMIRALRKSSFVDKTMAEIIEKRNRKVVRMLLIMILLHFSCTLPYNTYSVLSVFQVSSPSLIKQFVLMLSLANSMANPYLYWALSRQYRKAFWDMLSKCQCRRGRRAEEQLQTRRLVSGCHTEQLTPNKGSRSGRDWGQARESSVHLHLPEHRLKVKELLNRNINIQLLVEETDPLLDEEMEVKKLMKVISPVNC